MNDSIKKKNIYTKENQHNICYALITFPIPIITVHCMY